MSEQVGAYKAALTADTTGAVGGVLKLLNPEGVDLIITDFILDITTKSAGAATIDAGVDDGGDVSSDTLLDGVNVNAAAAVFSNAAAVKWPADEYIVATASASVAGLVGNAYIKYIRE
ncbi:MAG: hypothetical protein QM346_19870 [Chloroflexota bacterium]|nr:hypothetical protein [Chloroflexota bacterium]